MSDSQAITQTMMDKREEERCKSVKVVLTKCDLSQLAEVSDNSARAFNLFTISKKQDPGDDSMTKSSSSSDMVKPPSTVSSSSLSVSQGSSTGSVTPSVTQCTTVPSTRRPVRSSAQITKSTVIMMPSVMSNKVANMTKYPKILPKPTVVSILPRAAPIVVAGSYPMLASQSISNSTNTIHSPGGVCTFVMSTKTQTSPSISASTVIQSPMGVRTFPVMSASAETSPAVTTSSIIPSPLGVRTFAAVPPKPKMSSLISVSSTVPSPVGVRTFPAVSAKTQASTTITASTIIRSPAGVRTFPVMSATSPTSPAHVSYRPKTQLGSTSVSTSAGDLIKKVVASRAPLTIRPDGTTDLKSSRPSLLVLKPAPKIMRVPMSAVRKPTIRVNQLATPSSVFLRQTHKVSAVPTQTLQTAVEAKKQLVSILPKYFTKSGLEMVQLDEQTVKLVIPKAVLYDCILCDLTFSVVDLGIHLLNHLEGKLSYCVACVEGFSSPSHLVKHLLTHVENIIYEKNSTIRKIIPRKRPYVCELCGKGFGTKEQQLTHMRMHTGEKPFQCKICQKGFPRREALNLHTLRHTGQRPHKCSDCDKTFLNKWRLSQHMLCHSEERPYMCSICGRAFATKNSLYMHSKNHTKGMAFRCEICREGFVNKDNYSLHMAAHRGEEQVGNGDSGDINLDNQVTDNSGAATTCRTDYDCNICGKHFLGRPNLLRHMAVHSDARPYKCLKCDQTFKLQQTLITHMWTHADEKPHKCKVCGKGFIHKHRLTIHMTSHTARKKPHKCEICSLEFTLKCHLVRHGRTHEQKVQFKCDQCSAIFMHKSSLQIHQKTNCKGPSNKAGSSTDSQSSNFMYKCKICPSTFTQRYSLVKHMKILHPWLQT